MLDEILTMRLRPAGRLVAVLVAAALAAACGESPTEPGDDVNPALAAEANSAGFGDSGSGSLPQGSADFAGPGGLPMEMTAEEFVQQLTLEDGTVLRTSGIGVYAVPAATIASPDFDRVSFGAAFTGSLESVDPGTYDIGPWPPFDFIEPVEFAHAQVRRTGELARTPAEDGVITIESVQYLPDVYTCELQGNAFIVDRCDYQIGLLSGTIEFTATLDDGTVVVQERTDFLTPIRRRTIIVRRP